MLKVCLTVPPRMGKLGTYRIQVGLLKLKYMVKELYLQSHQFSL
jgi:hypothetical protein